MSAVNSEHITCTEPSIHDTVSLRQELAIKRWPTRS